MKIWALSTCFNRREQTLNGIRSLLGAAGVAKCDLSICLVDDGSSDGTAAAVATEFPSVSVIGGNGGLYWAGGMRFGWHECVKAQEFDFLLVFNDDVVVYKSAIETLLAAAREVEATGQTAYAVAGACRDSVTGRTTYSGVVRKHPWKGFEFVKLSPSGSLQACDALNMNIALISKPALSRIGFLSERFVHHRADYDFGLRLKQAGGGVFLAADYVGDCSRNDRNAASTEPGISLRRATILLFGPKEMPFRETVYYYRSYAGVLWPFLLFVKYMRKISRVRPALRESGDHEY